MKLSVRKNKVYGTYQVMASKYSYSKDVYVDVIVGNYRNEDDAVRCTDVARVLSKYLDDDEAIDATQEVMQALDVNEVKGYQPWC